MNDMTETELIQWFKAPRKPHQRQIDELEETIIELRGKLKDALTRIEKNQIYTAIENRKVVIASIRLRLKSTV